ncbi:MAG: hypothetical protein NC218_05430, partial [Acetobacter sp.]|nr:hypothetical protein [Acetobacter sp.]
GILLRDIPLGMIIRLMMLMLGYDMHFDKKRALQLGRFFYGNKFCESETVKKVLKMLFQMMRYRF